MLKRLLARLKQLFPLVDAGNYDSARVCKLYGSWARKGEHSEERPWRLSSIVNEGSGTVATEQQIMALLPATRTAPTLHPDDVKLTQLVGFLGYYGVPRRAEPREVSVERYCASLQLYGSMLDFCGFSSLYWNFYERRRQLVERSTRECGYLI
jgi:hypothetical protein